MQQGRKSSGGQGLPDRAAEEQATTRGRKRVRKALQGRILLRACIRFCPGTAYIVGKPPVTFARAIARKHAHGMHKAARRLTELAGAHPGHAKTPAVVTLLDASVEAGFVALSRGSP